MPDFRNYIDIDASEFVDNCSKAEIKELIEILVEDGYLHETKIVADGNATIEDIEWDVALVKLSNSRRYLSSEEEEFIKNLSKRF